MTDQKIEYALVDYDVHNDRSLYPPIYKHLKKVSLLFSESVYMVNLGQAFKIGKAFQEINDDLRKKGKRPITFNVTRIAQEEYEKMRERSIEALNKFAQFVAKSLLDRIERLEEKFNNQIDDPNTSIKKRGNALSRAMREIDMARGLATLFLIEQEVEAAVEASQKILDAEREMFTKKKQEEIANDAKA